ncbi:hypothetical protein VP01_156g1 [Puccinia sorghi]|uniref:Uncharacterized protein n=1 Tax=Puccinia sorghi TaxID=27349 RepID=A0A0L6VHU2_9BASI|nr:hypothetical protein VP01_156g1 [Puccinia sorghi]
MVSNHGSNLMVSNHGCDTRDDEETRKQNDTKYSERGLQALTPEDLARLENFYDGVRSHLAEFNNTSNHPGLSEEEFDAFMGELGYLRRAAETLDEATYHEQTRFLTAAEGDVLQVQQVVVARREAVAILDSLVRTNLDTYMPVSLHLVYLVIVVPPLFSFSSSSLLRFSQVNTLPSSARRPLSPILCYEPSLTFEQDSSRYFTLNPNQPTTLIYIIRTHYHVRIRRIFY